MFGVLQHGRALSAQEEEEVTCIVPVQVDIEDFRIVTESYGMQLDNDMILATFSKVCPMQCNSPLKAYCAPVHALATVPLSVRV